MSALTACVPVVYPPEMHPVTSAPGKPAMYQGEWPSFRENLAPLGDARIRDRLARAIPLP